MRREAQNILLLLVGGALLKITFDGTYLRYVKPTVKPSVIAAGIVMVTLAVIAIVADIRAVRPMIEDRTAMRTAPAVPGCSCCPCSPSS